MRHHLVQKPHPYHIIRDLIIIGLIVFILYLILEKDVFNKDVVVNVPKDQSIVNVGTPNVNIESPNIIVNVTDQSSDFRVKEYQKSKTAQAISDYYEENQGGLGRPFRQILTVKNLTDSITVNN